jgi:hypothetical protein
MMKYSVVLLSIAIATTTFADEAAGADVDESELVAGLLARADAIVSGRFQYLLTVGFVDHPERTNATPVELLVQHSSWKLVYPEGPSKLQQVNHGGKRVKYKQPPQLDGTVAPTVGIRREAELNADGPPYHPVCAGTIWFPETIKYIREHADEVKYKGLESVNEVESHVLEWDVPREDRFVAFHSINSLMDEGGYLRVNIVPQFGYALPRVEHRSRAGEVTTRFDSQHFREYNSVYLPRVSRYQVFNPNGQPGYFVEHELKEISEINDVIPDAKFSVSVAEGTAVADMRGPGGANLFEAHRGMIPEDIADIMEVKRRNGIGSMGAVLIGTVIGVIVLLVLVRLRRSSAVS